jgi:Na+/melibiose symporter-like transporter
MGKEKVINSDKIGVGKFLAWQSRGLSLAANFIIFIYLNMYCTDALNMPPALVGALLLSSKVFDGITDLFAGYLIDNTNTRWGKARPYEFAIFGVWVCTLLLFSAPAGASMTVKSIWVFLLYSASNAIFATLLNANGNPYMIRAFNTKIQFTKLSAYGGIIITLGCAVVSVSFPMAMASIATTPTGWSKLIAIYGIPLSLIGILRFVFVKETIKVDDESKDKIKFKELFIMLKNNKHIYPIVLVTLFMQLISGINVASYYFKYIVGNLGQLGMINMLALPILFVMAIFPVLMKKFTVSQIISSGAMLGAFGGVLAFFAGSNMLLLIIAYFLTGSAALAPSYLIHLMILDCGSYNEHLGYSRMDGTLGAVNSFASKVGNGVGTGLLGILLGIAGYNGAAAVQSGSATLMIRGLYGIVPAIGWFLVFMVMRFYKLDKQMTKIEEK